VKSPPPLYTTEVGPDSSHGQGGALLFLLVLVFGMSACAPTWHPEPFNVKSHAPSAEMPGNEDTLFEEAIRARKEGDAIGAIARLSALWQRGSDNPNVRYQLGIAFEVAEDFETAAAIYSQIQRTTEEPFLLRDATFRLALCLWELQENQAAYQALRALPENHAYTLQDRYSFDLAIGTGWMRIGRTKRGETRILQALVATEGSTEVHWIRSLALFALMEERLEKAGSLNFQVREKKQAKHLARRVARIKQAEDLLRRLMQLQEVDWMLAGWLSLGDAYAAFANDFAIAPAPRKLTAGQKNAYRELAEKQADALRIKAAKAYEWGIEVATRTGRQDHRRARSLVSRLKALPH
jgi:tetratricopeptide (TPR) repeat protein